MGLSTGPVLLRSHESGCSFAVGRGPFPCPGWPGPARTRSRFRDPHSPSVRRLPFEGAPVCLLPLPAFDRNRTCLGFLSWSSSKITLPPMSPCASTLGFPRFGVATPERVPPLSFFPTSAACSAHGFAGLLHPATGHRVRLVSRRPSTFADARRFSGASFPFEALRRNSGLSVARLPASSPLLAMTEAIAHPTSRHFSVPESHTAGVATRDASSSLGVPSTQAFTGAPRHRRLLLGSQLPGAFASGCPAARASGHSHAAAAAFGASSFPSTPLRMQVVALETGTGFPTVTCGCPQRAH